jgi:alpha-L-fucosidase
VVALFALLAAGLRTSTAPVTFQPTEQSFKQYAVPEWYRDAKFGIWSHGGPDSVPGISNNYARDMYNQGSADYQWHLAHYGHPSEVG